VSRIYAIALNTFREAVRDRVLYGMLAVAILMLLFSLALGELSLGQNERVVADVGMASISFFSVIMAVFLGASLLYKEIERKTLYVILPKPIARYEFLLGKYFGIVATAGVFVAIMGGVHLWVTAIQKGADIFTSLGAVALALAALGGIAYKARDRTAVVVPWALGFLALMAWFAAHHEADVGYLLAAFALNVGELALVAAVALLFSSFSTPFLTGAFALGVWVIGRSADTMASIRGSRVPEEVQALLHTAVKVVPNFHLFVPGRRALTVGLIEQGGVWPYVGQTLLYATAYATLLLVFASLIFRRRDFL
jgi:Cu-processing system permease protein